MTNADRIRKMSDSELAITLSVMTKMNCESITGEKYPDEVMKMYEGMILDWIKQEANC